MSSGIGEPAQRTRLVASALFYVTFLAYWANGRTIGSGDSRVTELTSQALLERGTFVLKGLPENDPFSKPVARSPDTFISIYPPATAIASVPIFAVARLFFDLDETGRAVAGKLSATLFAAGTAICLFLAWPETESLRLRFFAAVVFALGTNLWATSETLWQHPLTAFFLANALRLASKAPSAMTARSSFWLGSCLAAAGCARTAAMPMAMILLLGLMLITNVRKAFLAFGAALPLGATALYNTYFFAAPWAFGTERATDRFFGAWPLSLPGLLVSPGRGLLVFTPVAIIALLGFWHALGRINERPLARLTLAAFVTHVIFISAWNEWHGGESFGPRLLTDALPLLFLFFPQGIRAAPRLTVVFAFLSIGVQATGAFMYDYRWERLHQRGQNFDRALWSWRDSPLVFHWREGVITRGIPQLRDRRLRLPLARSVPWGRTGSRISFDAASLHIDGDALARDVRLERGARIADARVVLAHPQDAVAYHVLIASEGLVTARGIGTLFVECDDQSSEQPIASEAPVAMPLPACAGVAGTNVSLRAKSGSVEISEVRLERAVR